MNKKKNVLNKIIIHSLVVRLGVSWNRFASHFFLGWNVPKAFAKEEKSRHEEVSVRKHLLSTK